MIFFYHIWVDCIDRLQSVEAGSENWKWKSMLIMSISMVFNLLTAMVILQTQVFGYFFYEINTDFLSGEQNYVLTILILYVSPCVCINYLLIFRRKRYQKLLEDYQHNHKGKLVLSYMLFSIFFPIILLFISSI
jgi:hypothetical protein